MDEGGARPESEESNEEEGELGHVVQLEVESSEHLVHSLLEAWLVVVVRVRMIVRVLTLRRMDAVGVVCVSVWMWVCTTHLARHLHHLVAMLEHNHWRRREHEVLVRWSQAHDLVNFVVHLLHVLLDATDECLSVSLEFGLVHDFLSWVRGVLRDLQGEDWVLGVVRAIIFQHLDEDDKTAGVLVDVDALETELSCDDTLWQLLQVLLLDLFSLLEFVTTEF